MGTSFGVATIVTSLHASALRPRWMLLWQQQGSVGCPMRNSRSPQGLRSCGL